MENPSYTKLDEVVLGEKLGFPSDYFDGVINVGTIRLAPPESFDELIRIIKRGGYIVLSNSLRRYNEGGFKEKQKTLEHMRKWKFVKRTEPFLGLLGYDPSVSHYGFFYKVL